MQHRILILSALAVFLTIGLIMAGNAAAVARGDLAPNRPGWTIQTVDSTDDVGQYNALVLDSNINGPFFCEDTTDSESFVDNLNAYDPTRWDKADGWANPSPFWNGWRADHIAFSSGIMSLRLDDQPCPGGCSGRPYASGEYRTDAHYGYGCYEARLKAVCNEGTITSFFLIRDEEPYWPIPEIDWEFFGDSCDPADEDFQHGHTDFLDGRDYPDQPDSQVRHPQEVDLGFDTTAGFHTYGICWLPNPLDTGVPPTTSIVRWYADGVLKRQETVEFTDTYGRCDDPAEPCTESGMKVMINLWPTNSEWNEEPPLSGVGPGVFAYAGMAIYAEYDWVSYTPHASEHHWSVPTGIYSGTGASELPDLVVDSNDEVHAVWQNFPSSSARIFHAVRDLDGWWSEAEQISPLSDDSRYPAIAADSQGAVHAVWAYQRTGDRGSIYYAQRPAASGWSTPTALGPDDWLPTQPAIAVDSQDGIHVVWQGGYTGEHDLQYIYKPAGGDWQEPSAVWDTPSGATYPVLAASDEDTLHLVWIQNKKTLAYSSKPLTGTWTAPTIIYTLTGSIDDIVFAPDIATTQSNTVVVAWTQNPDNSAYAVELPDGGVWSEPVILSATGRYASGKVSLATTPSGRVLVAWGSNPVCYAERSQAGFWSASDCIPDSASALVPEVASDSHDIYHVVWQGAGIPYSHSVVNACHVSDVNQDGGVNLADLLAVAAAWHIPNSAPALDVDGSGSVDIIDVIIVASWWGMTCT